MPHPLSSLILRWVGVCGALVGLALPLAAQARLNLPQLSGTVTLAEAARQSVEAALASPSRSSPWEFPAGVEQTMVESLPAELRVACAEVVEHWGTVAEGTAQWAVRVLYRAPQPEAFVVFLAYRCGSSYPDYRQYYDERLAVLRIEPSAARLRLIPLGEDCQNCSDLYHVDFSQYFPVAGGGVVEFTVINSSDNPCCDGITQWREERLLFLLTDGSAALSLLRASEHYYHDDVEGDSEDACDATVGYDYDAAGRLAEISARTACREDSKQKPVESTRFHWNPVERRFEEVPPVQP